MTYINVHMHTYMTSKSAYMCIHTCMYNVHMYMSVLDIHTVRDICIKLIIRPIGRNLSRGVLFPDTCGHTYKIVSN